MDDLKIPKIRFLGFWQKSYPLRYAFLLQHEVPMYQNNMFAKIWFLNYDPKPQNAGFFKSQYLTKNLRYEAEFLDMIRGPIKH